MPKSGVPLMIFLLLMLTVFPIYYRTSLSITLAYAWVIISACRVCMTDVYAGNPESWISAMDAAATRSLLEFVVMCTAIFFFKIKYWKIFFQCVAVTNVVFLIIPPHWGLFSNASMAGCFAVATLPLFYSKRLILGLHVLAILISSRHQPLLGLSILCTLYFWRARHYWVLAGIPIVGGLLAYFLTGDFGNSNGRYELWQLAMNFWKEHANLYLGFGSGAFGVIGPAITDHKYIWLHSDYLQILFEQGIIGVILALAVAFDVLKRLKRKLFDAFLMLLVCAIANMPLRYPLFALYGAYIIRLVFLVQAPPSLKSTHIHAPNYLDLPQKLAHWRSRFDVKYKLAARSLSIWF